MKMIINAVFLSLVGVDNFDYLILREGSLKLFINNKKALNKTPFQFLPTLNDSIHNSITY